VERCGAARVARLGDGDGRDAGREARDAPADRDGRLARAADESGVRRFACEAPAKSTTPSETIANRADQTIRLIRWWRGMANLLSTGSGAGRCPGRPRPADPDWCIGEHYLHL
jgi:hypothetical protein